MKHEMFILQSPSGKFCRFTEDGMDIVCDVTDRKDAVVFDTDQAARADAEIVRLRADRKEKFRHFAKVGGSKRSLKKRRAAVRNLKKRWKLYRLEQQRQRGAQAYLESQQRRGKA